VTNEWIDMQKREEGEKHIYTHNINISESCIQDGSIAISSGKLDLRIKLKVVN